MRSVQELQNIRQDAAVKAAAVEIVGNLETRIGMRNLGTIANLPSTLVGLPVYDEDGNAIEYMRYGDAYGDLPLKPEV